MSRILEVPLLEPDSFLTIDVGTDLADDPAEVCQLLTDEKCAPKWWLAIASAYAYRQMYAAAIQVVTSGLENCSGLKSDESKADFHVMLSWLNLALMRQAETQDKRAFFDSALQSGNRAFQGYQTTSGDARKLSIPAVLAQGALYLAVGNVNDALPCFQTVLAVQPQNVYAKMGRARVIYARKNYKGALKLYQEVLKQAPQARPGVSARIGMGVCFWRLHDAVKARKSWSRAIAVDTELNGSASYDSGVASALLGVAELTDALKGQRAAFAAHYSEAIEKFQAAYKLGITALPALKIASYLFSKHDMGLVGKLTDRAIATATRPELMGEAMFWKARAAHYAKDLDLALTLYTQAASAHPGNVAASIGKGIIELCQDRVAEALLTLELVVQQQPKDPYGLLYSGLFSAKIDPTKARALLESYVSRQSHSGEPLRYEALITLAQLWESSSPQKALSYLRQAQALLPETPRELRINIGTLEFALRNYEEAELNFNAVEDKDTLVKFNLARAREARLAEAGTEKLQDITLESIIEEYKSLNILEAQARLTLVNQDPKVITANLATAQRLVDQNPGDLELRALYAWHLRNAQRHASLLNEDQVSEYATKEQELLKQTLTSYDKHDTYSLVSLGNIYLRNAAASKSDRARQNRSFMRAGELFEKVLKLDSHNAYAAQGVAVGLVYSRNAKVAQSVFSRLRETLLGEISTIINSAHCLMDAGDYARASELYEYAYKKKPSKSLAIFIGWSWFARGCRSKDVGALLNALNWSKESATEINDNLEGNVNLDAREFNVALVELQLGDVIRRKPAGSRTLTQLEATLKGVESATALLQSLSSDARTLPFSTSDLEEKADFAEHTLLPQLAQVIDEQRKYEQNAEEKRIQAVKKREEEHKIAIAANEQRESERIAREESLAQERTRLQEEAMEWEAQRQARREAESSAGDGENPKKSKKSKKSKKDVDDDDEEKEFDPNAPQSDSESDAKSSDDDEPAPSVPDNENEEAPASGKIERQKAMVDDDDDSDEEEPVKGDANGGADEANGEANGEGENKAGGDGEGSDDGLF